MKKAITFSSGAAVGALCIGIIYLATVGAVRARLDILFGCPSITPSRGEVQAPKFCDDLTHIPLRKVKDIRRMVREYGDSLLQYDPDSGDIQVKLKEIDWPVRASIIPVRGARKLHAGDLSRRGRIVAKIVTNQPYEHGITIHTSYVWVDYGPLRGWRVLIIPQNDGAPISVLSNYKVDGYPYASSRTTASAPAAGLRGSIQLYASSEQQDAHLNRWVRENCKYKPGTDHTPNKNACWFNVPPALTNSDPGLDEVTDGWVFVTGSGCVCVGTKCHEEMATGSRGTQH